MEYKSRRNSSKDEKEGKPEEADIRLENTIWRNIENYKSQYEKKIEELSRKNRKPTSEEIREVYLILEKLCNEYEKADTYVIYDDFKEFNEEWCQAKRKMETLLRRYEKFIMKTDTQSNKIGDKDEEPEL